MLGLEEVNRPVSLRKRDGRLVAFVLDKIGAAIEAAGLATGEFEQATAQALAAQVLVR
ncbi:ATP cone domain-containing protein, partial [uncultured Stutzerimonas sp.]